MRAKEPSARGPPLPMRYFLLLAALGLLFGAATAAPLPADTLRIARLPAAGLLLNKGWRYHAGDDPAWARPDFDDSGWDTLNPARPRRELSPRLRTGISWLRLRFQLGDSLRQRAVLLQAVGYGAWEIYLNGRLVQRAGTVQANPTQVPDPGKLPPVVVPAGGPAGQVLAIRFAPWQSPLLRLGPETQLLDVFLRSEAQVGQRAARKLRGAIEASVVAGIFGLLTLLHLAFFRYYPTQRANLYFAFSALALALHGLINFAQWTLESPVLEVVLPLELVANLVFTCAYLWVVRALYALFGFRLGWIYRVLWVAFWVQAALSLYDEIYARIALLGLIFFTFVELLRLTGRALRQRQRGAQIIGTGFAVNLLYLVVSGGCAVASALLKVPDPFAQPPNWFSALLGLVLYLSPALGISLYLAREFALDSQLLLVKLREVERLSAQTIAQEQDKQALLAAQNETLEQQVTQRTGELQRSLTELRATQAQLIQREKMASLGELTAGIAHEIQNPLNFVNNFSEVSTELVAELKEAQAAGDAEEVSALADDLTQNLSKISQHGQRAASIVRGMLEHSRQSTGERAPVDVNALAEEYLRLAYQGLRAKDKSFNATLSTDFGADLPLVSAVGADVGRVLLNLFTNAFYAVRQRQQQAGGGEAGYQPRVGVRTRVLDQRVQIQVSDNGTGIPDAVRAKIFQPFFTTKPTGEGTGLGLSLSYDIIAQGHGGTLTVESQEGEGTTFSVGLPVNGATYLS